MGAPPLRVDVMMSIPGVSFVDVWENRETVMIADTEMQFIGKADLIKAKTRIWKTSRTFSIYPS